MSNASVAIGILPFVRNGKPKGTGRDFWVVTPTGNDDIDHTLGRGYAIEAVEMAVATDSPSLVAKVMKEMGRNPEWRSIEDGFMRGLADLACMTMSMARGNAACVCAHGASRNLTRRPE